MSPTPRSSGSAIKVRYHYTRTRGAKIQNPDSTKAGKDVGEQRPGLTAPGKAGGAATVWPFLTKLNMLLTIQSSQHTLWYLLKGVEKLCPHKTLHMMFIGALFLIVKT